MPSCPYCDRQWPVGVPHWCPQMQAADNKATADKKPEGGQPAVQPPGRVRKGAIVTAIAAQLGQWNENFS